MNITNSSYICNHNEMFDDLSSSTGLFFTENRVSDPISNLGDQVKKSG